MRMWFLILFLFFSLMIPTVFPHTSVAQSADAIAAREAQLRAELDQVLKEIAGQQAILKEEQAKGTTLKGDIAILTAQIKQAQLKIRAHEIAIVALGKDTNKKTETIDVHPDKIEKNKQSWGQIMRKTNMADSVSLPEIILGSGKLSDFFIELDQYDSVKELMQVSFADLKNNRVTAENEKQSLDKKRIQEIDEKISVQDEQAKIKKAETEKQRLLNLSVQQQKNYQGQIAGKEQRAAQIRTALFSLRDTAAIPFGDALQFANLASAKTGVRPAFLLAILTQESNLGKNTGSCFLKDTATGAGAGANTGTPIAKVMNPTRDVPVFITLMQGLGRDPFSTRVSCPQSIGWGGAMGPAQFIPSTWKLLQTSIAGLLGKGVPDPWIPQDAFMASALYLSNLGAGSKVYSAERDAACRYYSGKSCASGVGGTYGNQVMAKAATIQTTMIDPLQGF